MTVFEKLLEPISKSLEEIEGKRKKHGNEGVSWAEFMRVLVYFFVSRSDSRNTLVRKLKGAAAVLGLPKMGGATITEAFQRFDPGLARQLLGELLKQGGMYGIPELGLLGQIVLIDGSYFRLAHMVEWERERVRGVKLHLAFGLNQMMAIDFVVGSDKSNERKVACNFLQAGALYVMDRGYMSYEVVSHAVQVGARVIIRAPETLKAEIMKANEIKMPVGFMGIWTEVSDGLFKPTHKAAEGLVLRLVEFKVGETRYRLVVTDMNLSTFEVIMLYGYRWQIEIMFRYMKHVMKGVPLITESQRGVQSYFSMMFVTAILYMILNFENLIAEEALASEWEDGTRSGSEVEIVATNAESLRSGEPRAKKKSQYWPILINSYVAGGFGSIGSPF